MRVPAASRASTWACGSGARVSTTGTPSSAAASAAAIEPTSAIRRWMTSTGPAERRMRRIALRVATRRGQASAACTGGPHSGTEA